MILDLPKLGPVRFDDNLTDEQFNAQLSALSQKYGFEIPRGELTTGEMASRAFTRGTKQLGSVFGDIIPAMAAKGLGFDEYAQRQMEEAAATQRELATKYAPQYRGLEDVKGISDVPGFALETLVEQIPNIATSLIPGVGAGAVAARSAATTIGKQLAVQAAERGLAGEAAEAFVLQGMKQAAPQIAAKAGTAQNAGVFLGSYAQNAPEIFQNIYDQTGTMDVGAAMLFGSASAALDSVLPATLARQLTGPVRVGVVESILGKAGMDKGVLRSITAGVLKDMGIEGVTEGMQEAISVSAENFVAKNPQVFDSDDWKRIMESTVRGSIAGGGFGAVGGGVEGLKQKAEQERRRAEILEKRGQRQEAARVRRELEAIEAQIADIEAGKVQAELPGFETGPASGFSPAVLEALRNKTLPPSLVAAKAAVDAKNKLTGKQVEMFDAEGNLTTAVQKAATADEKRAAIRARQEAQREAAALKEQQNKLRKLLSGTQMTLPGMTPEEIKATETQRAAIQAQAAETGQGDLFAGMPAAPAPTPSTTLIGADKDSLKAFGKQFGIGPTASILRSDGPLAGKDIANPEDAAEVKRILEAYASGKPAAGAAEKIADYLKRPEFAALEGATDERGLGEAVPARGEPSVSVPSGAEAGIGVTPAVAEPTPTGMEAVSKPAVSAGVGAEQVVPAVEGSAYFAPEAFKEVDQGYKSRSKIINMSPDDFLRMAEPGLSKERIEEVRNVADEGTKFSTIPKLTTQEDPKTGQAKVIGSDGRHRATVLKEKGVTSMPVEIRSMIRWSEQDDPDKFDYWKGQWPTTLEAEKSTATIPYPIKRSFAAAPTEAAPITEPTKRGRPKLELTPEQEQEKQQQRRAAQGAARDAGRAAQRLLNVVQTPFDPSQHTAETLPDAQREHDARMISALAQAYQIANDPAFRNNTPGQIAQQVIQHPNVTPRQREIAQNRLAREKAAPAKAVITSAAKQDRTYAGFTTAAQAVEHILKTGTRFERFLAARLSDVLKNVRVQIVSDPSEIENAKARAEFEIGDPLGLYHNKVIYLNARTGLNTNTFLHEAIHAATVSTIYKFAHKMGKLDNRTKVFVTHAREIQKQAKKYYEEMLDKASKDPIYANEHEDTLLTLKQLSDSKGPNVFEDLREFFSYGITNPDMQEFLMKAPGTFTKEGPLESLFSRFVNAIRRLIGLGPEHSSAFQDLLIITDQIVKPIKVNEDGITPARAENLARDTMYEIGRIGQNIPQLTTKAAEGVRNMLSNAPSDLVELGTGILRLDNINTIYGKDLPSIQKLLDALEKRNGMQEQRIKRINDNYIRFNRIAHKQPQAVERMNDMAYDARLAQVDILDPNFKPTPAQAMEYNRLKGIYNKLPSDVQEIYRTIRGEYDSVIKEYENILFGNTETGEPGVLEPSVAKKLRGQYEARKRQIAYIPFLRRGDFWVEYTGSDGERHAQAFQSIRERQLFIQNELKGIEHKTYQNLNNASFKRSDIPPTSFIGQVINNLSKQGASETQMNEVYQAYLALFPAESLAKRFMKADNVRGMERDIIRGYGDTMIKWSRKLAASKYLPQVDQAISEIQAQADNANTPQVYSVAQNIMSQQDFFRNPTYGNMVSRLTAFSYFEYIAGNVSSAIVNLTTLPFFSWSILGGRFGFTDASSALLRASRIAIDGMEKHPRYSNLYKELMDHAQLEHTTAREVLEGRRQTTGDYTGIKARLMDAISIPFAATERLNRGATAVAAYDLARNSGMNEKDAIRYAITTVKDINTSGISATAPRWMQTPLGRIFFTFKSFTFNSAFVIARAFHQAFKGESPEIRRIARRQLLGVYGMSMAFAGVKGMPFMGAVNTLAEMLHALFGDDDEPFDVQTEMRDFFGELPYKGILNHALNIEVSDRAGIAQNLLFRDDPRGVAENGLVLTAMKQAFGPAGSYLFGAERGLRDMSEGNVARGVEALLPSFARNGYKAFRFMQEGALTRKGDPIDTDINAWNIAMQSVGFAPADLSETYERISAAKSYERRVHAEKANILNLFTMANKTGDSDLRAEAEERRVKFNANYPKLAITNKTLERSNRASKAAEKNLIHGVKFDPKLRPEIEDKFFDD